MDEIVASAARIGVVGVGLIGGALFAFSTFIMAALKRLDEAEGIRAMQLINKTVYTPWFMGPFFGTSLLSIASILVAFMNMDQRWWLPLLCAGVLFGLGVFVVTAVGNVPLNQKLDGMDADDAATAEYWRRYLVIWTRLNHVRVAASVGSLLFLNECIRTLG